MKIYCIIATYNAERWIEKCLKSVVESSIQCCIVVIDNQSSDRTVQLIESHFQTVILIKNSENVGFGKANNIGLRLAYQANADYFFLLNQDAWVETDTIRNLVEKHHQHPEYGILSPLQYYDRKTLDRKFQSYLKGNGNEIITNLSSEVQEAIHPVGFVNAAVWLMSRACLESVGIFAPIFDQYGEDLNYAHRCKFHNVKIGIYPRTIAFHEREQFPPKEKGIHLNKLLIRDKHYCFGVLMNLKHSYARQWMFLIFTSLKEGILSIFLLRFKTLLVILSRAKCLKLLVILSNQRKQMKQKGAFLFTN